MKYSVVITTYNRLKLLKECVEHVLAQTLPFEHIMIINNACTDGTREYLCKVSKENPKVLCRNLAYNTGGAGGFYEGVKVACHNHDDYLLFIDDDAILNLDYMEEIDKVVQEYRSIAGAFSGIVTTDGKINYLHRYFLEHSAFFNMKPVEEKYYQKKIFQYDLGTFCGLVLSMEVIKKIGLPDKSFFISYDDTEYCMRVIKHTPIINVNTAVLNHREKASEASRYSWKRYYGYRNKILLGMRYTKLKPVYAAKMAFWHFLRMGKCVYRYAVNDNREEQWPRFVQHFDAWSDGVRGRMGVREKYLP